MSEGKRAILIGNAAYPAGGKLTTLRCPLNDVDDLGKVLADPNRGGFDPVVLLRDRTSQEVRHELERFLLDVQQNDTVLFFYSGHGKLDESHKNLYLCACDTETTLLKSSAVRFGFVDDLLKNCAATKTAVILDCCYSGAALGSWSKGDLETIVNHAVREGSGSFLLTASDAIETAQEKEGDRNGVFTKHVIGGLTNGVADRDGRGFVTMDDLWRHVSREVPADGRQRPNHESNGNGEIIVAKSGKDSRKDRAARAIRLLYRLVSEEKLDSGVANAVEVIAAKAPAELSDREKTIDGVLDQLLKGELTHISFATAYWRAQSLITNVEAPRLPSEVRVEPALNVDQTTFPDTEAAKTKPTGPSKSGVSEQPEPGDGLSFWDAVLENWIVYRLIMPIFFILGLSAGNSEPDVTPGVYWTFAGVIAVAMLYYNKRLRLLGILTNGLALGLAISEALGLNIV